MFLSILSYALIPFPYELVRSHHPTWLICYWLPRFTIEIYPLNLPAATLLVQTPTRTYCRGYLVIRALEVRYRFVQYLVPSLYFRVFVRCRHRSWLQHALLLVSSLTWRQRLKLNQLRTALALALAHVNLHHHYHQRHPYQVSFRAVSRKAYAYSSSFSLFMLKAYAY